MVWVKIGWGLISMKVPYLSPAAATAWFTRAGWRTLSAQ
nr:hypothetical protein CPGR_00416 [Mycolicibacter nonchromogenicus]